MGRAIALLTDFGTDDIYVGVMKGVMHAICSDATFIDITHAIEPQNIKQAAFALLNSYKYFAPGTVFLVVVDPGVGSERHLIAVDAGGYVFVAPDNGVLSYVLEDIAEQYGHVYLLNNSRFRLSELGNHSLVLSAAFPYGSNTFHGRDILAPIAACAAKGLPLHQLGTQRDLGGTGLEFPYVYLKDGVIRGEVLHIDHFGNVATNIDILSWNLQMSGQIRVFDRETPLSVPAANFVISIDSRIISGIRRNYSEVKSGELLALIDSNGYLEIAVNQGSAAESLNVKVGDPVSVRIGNT